MSASGSDATSEPLDRAGQNAAFSAFVSSGHSVEAAALAVLQQCAAHHATPAPSLLNNVLGALSREATPAAVLTTVLSGQYAFAAAFVRSVSARAATERPYL